MLHVWYMYLQNWVMFMANVGTYSIHGACGLCIGYLSKSKDRICLIRTFIYRISIGKYPRDM